MTENDALKVKDQLGRPENKGFTIKRFNDTVVVEENVAEIATNIIGTSRIYGHPVQSAYGSATYTYGERGRAVTVNFVVNSEKVFREHFRDNHFQDTSAGQATVDTTNFRINFG